MTSDLTTPQGFKPQYEAFAIYDAVKLWYFERLQKVMWNYFECLNKTEPSETLIHGMRANAITLFTALREKIERQSHDKDDKLLIETVDKIVQNPFSRDTHLVEGDTPGKKFSFWAKVVTFEIMMLDQIGITKIDMEKKSAAEAFLLGAYNKSK